GLEVGVSGKLAAFAVRTGQFTMVLFTMLIALGIASWNHTPRLEDPPIDFPTFTVVAVYPGASPTDLERLVVIDLEKKLDALENVKHIDSRARDGVATIRVEFEVNEDPDKKYDEVVREVNAMRPTLPSELTRLEVNKSSTKDVSIVEAALVSETATYGVLDSLAHDLEDDLSALPGVRDAERWGAPERQVDVELDLGRLEELHLPIGQVLAAIGGESADIPGGSVEAGRRSFSVRSSGSYTSLDEIRATVLRGQRGHTVTVGDVGRVTWGYADSTYRARFDGHRTVLVTATQQSGTTVQTVRDRVYQELDRFEKTLPRGVTLRRGFDQAANVSRRLERLEEDFLIALALVL